jgi:hypothetical protein
MPYSIRFKMIETNWKWQASEGEDNSCITSTWSYQWSEATRLCFNHEGHINPSVHLVQIKKKKKRKCEKRIDFFYSHFPVYITQTYTWRIQSHTRKNSIVRNDIISNELSSCTVLLQVNLIESSCKHVSRREIRTFSFSSIDYICIYQGQMSNFIFFLANRILTV